MSKFTDILEAGCRIAAASHYLTLQRSGVAAACHISPSLVSYYFKDVDSLREAVMHYAVRESNVAVVLQGLVAGDPIAIAAPESLRATCLARIAHHG